MAPPLALMAGDAIGFLLVSPIFLVLAWILFGAGLIDFLRDRAHVRALVRSKSPSGSGRGTAGGVEWRWCHGRSGGLRGSRMRFSIALPCAPGPAFFITQEGEGERAAKSAGFVRDVETGDAEFDARYLVYTPAAPTFALRVLDAPDRRAAVDAIFAARAASICCTGGWLFVEWARPDIRRLDEGRLAAAAHGLAELAAAIPDPAPSRRRRFVLPRTRPHVSLVAPFVLFALGALARGLLGEHLPLDSFDLGLRTLWLGVPLGIASVAWALRQEPFRRGAWVAAALAAIVVVGAVASGTWWITLAANAALDRSPSSRQVVDVLEETSTCRRDEIVVRSWRPGQGSERLRMAGGRRSVIPGRSRVRVETRPGRFGYEWVVSCSPEPEAAPGAAGVP